MKVVKHKILIGKIVSSVPTSFRQDFSKKYQKIMEDKKKNVQIGLPPSEVVCISLQFDEL